MKKIEIKKKGIGAVIAGVCLLGLVFLLPPAAERGSFFASANLERKLPIYCVQTDEPKVSVSFDAAWGAGKYRRKI